MKKLLFNTFYITMIVLLTIMTDTFATNIDQEDEIVENEQQQEQLIKNGTYEISVASNSELVVSISSDTYIDCTNINIATNEQLKRQKFYITYDNDKDAYIIKSLKGNKVLDVKGGRKENYSNVQLYEYNGTLAQQWEIKSIDNYYYIISKNSNKCLDINGGQINSGSNIQIYESNGTNAQKFIIKKVEELECEKIIDEGYYYISSALSKDKVVNVNSGSYNNIANINIWDKNNKEYQKFRLTYDSNNKSYSIMVAHSDKALDVYGSSQKNGANVIQYQSNNTEAQRWIIKKTNDGYFNIVSKCNGLYLDLYGASIRNGSNIQTYQPNGTNAQKFEFMETNINVGEKTIEDGTYNIVTKIDDNKVLEIEGKSTANNKKIQISQRLSVVNKSQAFEIKYLGNGYYSIKSKKSGKMLEVENGAHINGTKIQQNVENESNIQKWIIKESEEDGYYYLISKCNGLYLDIPGRKTDNETKLQMYEGNNSIAQLFRFDEVKNEINTEKTIEDGFYTICSCLNTNKVLDISGGKYNNGANLQIWSKDSVQQQKFKVTYNEEEKNYEIKSVNSGRVLDVTGNGKIDGTNVTQYDKNNSIAQKWAIQKAENEEYYIIALNSGLYLDVKAGQTSNGTNVQIYEGNETNAQKFIFKPTIIIDEDFYKITIKKDSNKCLDISGGSKDEDANLQIWTLDNVNQQVFEVEKIDSTYYKIIPRHSNKVLTSTNTNNVVQTTYNDQDNQKWSFEIAGDGYYKIKSKLTGLYLDVYGNGTGNGTNVGVYEENDSTAQMFRLNTLLKRKGIDVSHHNGEINWKQVKQSGQVDYAIIRAGYRGYRSGTIVKDLQFENNIRGIKENRIDIGLYFFTQAINIQEAIEEANYVIDLVRKNDIYLRYPIYIDSEYTEVSSYDPGRADGLDKETRTAVCKAFCDTIRNAGYIPGIYASKNWFYNNLEISQLGSYDIWVAHYTGDVNKQTDYKYKYDMWQYTSSGSISGVYGPVQNGVARVDLNLCYKNY